MGNKNVIFLVVDSLLYDKLGVARDGESPTPFIDKLISKSISTTRMYSQAPFTEAAVMALICGCDTMDNGGYLKSYKTSKKTVLEAFKENGYDVLNYILPYVYPSELKRGVTDVYYQRAFDFNIFYSCRMYYYVKLYKNNKISKSDYSDFIELLEDNLKSWIELLTLIETGAKEAEIISNNIKNYDVIRINRQVREEYEKFILDKLRYSKELLSRGKNHKLFNIETIKLNYKIKDEKIKERIKEEYYDFIKESYEFNKKCNKDNKISNFLNQIKSIIVESNLSPKIIAKGIMDYRTCSKSAKEDNDFLLRIESNYDKMKEASSLNTHFNHYLKWLSEREKKENPYFAYLHFDDVHNPEMFFTYDTNSMDLIYKEFNYLKKYRQALSSNFRGSLSYDYSLVYLDNCIKNLFNKLEGIGELDKSYFIITSDHGFSFANDPVRRNCVTNFYSENYHIPFIIYNKDLKAMRLDDIYSSKDIPATLLDLCNIKIPENFTGKSIFDELNKKEYIYHEYMGGGCPDITRRPVLMCAKDSRYSVSFSVNLNEDFDKGRILSIYDIRSDPNELKNLVGLFSKKKQIQDFIKIFNKRYVKLKNM